MGTGYSSLGTSTAEPPADQGFSSSEGGTRTRDTTEATAPSRVIRCALETSNDLGLARDSLRERMLRRSVYSGRLRMSGVSSARYSLNMRVRIKPSLVAGRPTDPLRRDVPRQFAGPARPWPSVPSLIEERNEAQADSSCVLCRRILSLSGSSDRSPGRGGVVAASDTGPGRARPVSGASPGDTRSGVGLTDGRTGVRRCAARYDANTRGEPVRTAGSITHRSTGTDTGPPISSPSRASIGAVPPPGRSGHRSSTTSWAIRRRPRRVNGALA